MLSSVVISTHNRADALAATLAALGRQDCDDYEVIVVDDGSTDATPELLAAFDAPYRLRTLRLVTNSGVAAGRNAGMRAAVGRWLILLSDDLLVGEHFVSAHVEMLERFPNSWVVGGFRQLESLSETPFGRYLDELERGFERGRRSHEIAPGVHALQWPTARNLSLPRSDIERVGLFDERFRVCCEDQDLAQRAAALGVRFVHAAAIDSVHNDQAGDLRRYCEFQRRGARDTVALCRKWPQVHGAAPIVRANNPVGWRDGPALAAKKLIKRVLTTAAGRRALFGAVSALERLSAPERLLRRLYRAAIGIHIFAGWREGMRSAPR